MDRKQIARKHFESGTNCAGSVYAAFADRVSGSVPAPRSEGGKCGAVLAAEKVLAQMGLDSAAFDEAFLRTYGSLKCGELKRARIPCAELVDTATKLTEAMLGEPE